jgi:hypothetical protein
MKTTGAERLQIEDRSNGSRSSGCRHIETVSEDDIEVLDEDEEDRFLDKS